MKASEARNAAARVGASQNERIWPLSSSGTDGKGVRVVEMVLSEVYESS